LVASSSAFLLAFVLKPFDAITEARMTTIANAQPQDLPDVLALLDRSELPRDGLADHFDLVLVARDGAQIVGSAAIERYGDAGLLRSVAVDSAYRSQGLGAQLVGSALEQAQRAYRPFTCSPRRLRTSSRASAFAPWRAPTSRPPCSSRWSSRAPARRAPS
jgi:GNAT superfamily N-acetyltransferase